MSGLSQTELDEMFRGLVPAIRFLEETGSTNEVAGEWAEGGAPTGAMVVADYQSAGRGRLDRSWYAPPGECLLFSTILRPLPEDEPSAGQLALLNLAAAVALCRAVSPFVPARVKWPNDVMVNGRKIGGILSAIGEGGGGDHGVETYVVIGVGLNVNVAEFPEELSGMATSLLRETGKPASRLDLLGDYLVEFARIYLAFPQGVLPAYEPLCETLGRRVRVELSGRTLEDEATGLDPTGGLLLANGEVVRAGDVVHLRSAK